MDPASGEAVAYPEPMDSPRTTDDVDRTAQRADPEHAAPQPPDWWHREHPTFTSLMGFFTGLAFVCIVPGLFVSILQAVFDWRTAEEAFPFVALFLLVPLGLVVWPGTRRFGKYMLFGMVISALVVLGVGSFVFWLMTDRAV